MHTDFQTYRFVLLISIIAAFLLSITSTTLSDLQDFNIEVDRKKNVLKCVGMDLSGMNSEDIVTSYNSVIQEKVISLDGNNTKLSMDDVTVLENKSTGQLNYEFHQTEYLPIYEFRLNNILQAYIFPISGKGLWSTLYGYIALATDLNTVKGITFYKHKETAGLGGEVDKEWFQSNFSGKKIFNKTGELTSIKVVKGVASGSDLEHKVDGISGATMTCSGLTKFLYNDLERYLPFINLK